MSSFTKPSLKSCFGYFASTIALQLGIERWFLSLNKENRRRTGEGDRDMDVVLYIYGGVTSHSIKSFSPVSQEG